MFDKKSLYTAVSLLAIPVMGAYAATPPAPDAGALEEIVVTGVRASEQRSVELKRDASVIQDSISAEDIGKLPDTTCLLYTSPSPRDRTRSRMPSSA